MYVNKNFIERKKSCSCDKIYIIRKASEEIWFVHTIFHKIQLCIVIRKLKEKTGLYCIFTDYFVEISCIRKKWGKEFQGLAYS